MRGRGHHRDTYHRRSKSEEPGYVDLNYLQKFYATKFKCTEDILIGYEATRIQLSQANVEIKPLNKLCRNGNMYVTRKGFRSRDYDKQSKNFYQILLKTEAFQGFDQGLILMDDKATTCDGYGVMQELLRMVLPVYTQKAPPKVAPMYEDDIYAYQKAM